MQSTDLINFVLSTFVLRHSQSEEAHINSQNLGLHYQKTNKKYPFCLSSRDLLELRKCK